PARDPRPDPRRVTRVRQVRAAERAGRLPGRNAPGGDDGRPVPRARPPRTARDGVARTLRVRACDLRARSCRPGRPAAGHRDCVMVRFLLWNLADSKTSLDELRPRLEASPNRTWI